jgi:Putative beta-barrel porin-2, OmpL-like. bbp2
VRFDNPVSMKDYEAIPATANFFYSHSLTFNNSGPFTYTGVLNTCKVTCDTTVWAGSEVAEGFKLTISAEGGSLVAQIIAGTLDGLKAKLDHRSRKKRWGSF